MFSVKKMILVSFVFLCAAMLGFSQEASKPVKKVPVREGNFEVVAGGMVDVPIDMVQFAKVATQAARAHGWKVLSSEEGVVSLKLEKRDWWVTMNICYWEDEYWYEYQDSWNLDANPEKNKIHRNYLRWIANIEKRIFETY